MPVGGENGGARTHEPVTVPARLLPFRGKGASLFCSRAGGAASARGGAAAGQVFAPVPPHHSPGEGCGTGPMRRTLHCSRQAGPAVEPTASFQHGMVELSAARAASFEWFCQLPTWGSRNRSCEHKWTLAGAPSAVREELDPPASVGEEQRGMVEWRDIVCGAGTECRERRRRRLPMQPGGAAAGRWRVVAGGAPEGDEIAKGARAGTVPCLLYTSPSPRDS